MENTQVVESKIDYLHLKHWDGEKWVHYSIRRADDRSFDKNNECAIMLLKIKSLFEADDFGFPIFCIFPNFVCGLMFSNSIIQSYYYNGHIENPSYYYNGHIENPYVK